MRRVGSERGLTCGINAVHVGLSNLSRAHAYALFDIRCRNSLRLRDFFIRETVPFSGFRIPQLSGLHSGQLKMAE